MVIFRNIFDPDLSIVLNAKGAVPKTEKNRIAKAAMQV